MISNREEMVAPGNNQALPPVREVEHRQVCDEVDEQLLPIFLEEANELYPKISYTLRAWRAQSGTDAALGEQLQRSLHTLKGSARMSGAMRLGELTHRIEGRIAAAIVQEDFDSMLWNDLDSYLDRMGCAIDALADRSVAADEAAKMSAQRRAVRPEVSSSNVSERLYRVAQQTAKELGKRVNFELVDGGLKLNCGVLEKMTAPLEHLLRNAIAHGIEKPEQRERLGKAIVGEISLVMRQQGKELVLLFSDDGAGLDMASLQQKALEHGILRAGEELNESLATQMIFRPGLSTAREITEIAGRGIGLDVVKSEVCALGGRLDVVSTQGRGLSFTIHLPLI